MRLARWVLILTAACCCSSVSANPSLQQDVERLLAEEQLTGIAWALVPAPGEIREGVAGWRDQPGKLPFTQDTRFHVGSLTKTVLATGVLRLATEGRIDLDDPAIEYLPALFTGDVPDGFGDITVRHLLDHTSSLNDAQLWQMFSERANADDPLTAAFPEPERQLALRGVPGARFSYSNIGYTLLGMIIETVTGVRYEQHLDEQLLLPLSMADSTFTFTTQAGSTIDSSLAWGHIDDGSHYPAAPIFLRPAGQFTSTAGDLGRFMLFLMGSGRIDGQPFVREDLMRSRGNPAGTEASAAGLSAGYGLGLARRDRHGVVGYCHGGNIVGFVAMLCVFPEQGKAFAYSVNTDSETADYGRLDEVFIEALNIDPADTPESAPPPADVSAWQGHYLLSPNRFQTFDYLDRLFGSVRIRGSGEVLTMASLQRETRTLRSTGRYGYSANDRSTVSHVLMRSSAGEQLLSDGFQTFRKANGAYLFSHWVSLSLGLMGLAWIFLAGSATLITRRRQFLQCSIAPAYVGMLGLLLPVPLFFAQSFMALGDVTLASMALAATTLAIPATLLVTLYRLAKGGRAQRLELAHGFAAVCVLQWCTVLAMNGLLPFRLWAL